MSATYIVCRLDEAVSEELREMGITVHADCTSRLPSLPEIIECIDSLDGISYTELPDSSVENWRADLYISGADPITAVPTEISVLPPTPEYDEPNIGFRAGDDEIRSKVLGKFSERCGSLAMFVNGESLAAIARGGIVEDFAH